MAGNGGIESDMVVSDKNGATSHIRAVVRNVIGMMRVVEAVLWIILGFLLAPCNRTPVDVQLARNITAGCAYSDGFMYVDGRVYTDPIVVTVGSERKTLLGISSVESVTVSHTTSGILTQYTNFTRLRDVKCVETHLL